MKQKSVSNFSIIFILLVSSQKIKLTQLTTIKDDLQEKLNEILQKYKKIKDENDNLSDELTKLDYQLLDRKLKPKINDSVKFKKDSVLHHLKKTLKITKDENLQKILKVIEKKQRITIFGTEKFKFLVNLAELYEQIEDKLLSVDENTLFELEAQIKNISPPEDDNKNNGKGIIIGIHIQKEIEHDKNKKGKKKEDNEKVALMSVIEEDVLYEIKKKYTILDITKKAADYFNVDPLKFILINEKFQLYPFDLVLYDMILEENMKRGYVQSLCNYFQLSPKVSGEMKFTLIQKKLFKEYISNSNEEFSFVCETQITREIFTIYQDYKNQLSDSLNEKKKEDIKTLEEIISTLYGRKNIKIKLGKKGKQNKDEPNVSMNEMMNIRGNLTLKENAIIDKYQNFIDSFGMEYDTFFNYIREIYDTQEAIPDFKKYAEIQVDQNESVASLDSKKEKDDTFTYCSKKVSLFDESKSYFSKEKEEEKILNVSTYIINYRNNGLIPQNYLKRTYKLSKKENEIKCYKNYIKKRKEQMVQNQSPEKKKKFDFSNKKENEGLRAKKNLITMFQHFINLKTAKNPKISLALMIIEIICIILIYTFAYVTANKISIKEKVFYKEHIKSLFNKRENCIKQWKNNIFTYDNINKWIDACLFPVLDDSFDINNQSQPNQTNKYLHIPRIDFQVKNNKFEPCKGVESYDIQFYRNLTPQCSNKTELSNLELLLEKYGLKGKHKYYDKTLNFLIRLFSNDRRVEQSTMLSIIDKDNLEKFKNLFYSSDNMGFVGNTTSIINIDVFFVSNNEKYTIMESFNFASGNDDNSNYIETTNSSMYAEFNTKYYPYITFLIAIVFMGTLIAKQVLKKNKNIFSIIINNVFLILYFIFAFTGAIFIWTFRKSEVTADTIQVTEDQDLYDVAMVKYNTYQIIKSFEIIAITYHGVYTFFDSSQVIAYSYFFKSIFIRTLLVVCVFSLGIAVVLNAVLGSYFECYSTYLYSYLVVLTRLFGYVDLNEENGNVYMKYVSQNLSYLYDCLVGLQILTKVLVINLFFSYTLYYYKKYHCRSEDNNNNLIAKRQ